jgi:kojibiose phosphorylase
MAVNWYRRWSGDEAFYLDCGAQMLIETAQFWASRVAFDERRKRYVIRNLKCVDEYHKGVDNDAYTCYAAAENLRLGVEAARDLEAHDPTRFHALCREIGLTREEISRWSEIGRNVYFPLDSQTGMIEQFDGYFALPDETVTCDADGWPIEPDEPDRLYRGETQLIKQADVVLLFYLFGDRFTDEVKRRNFLYYLARDTQGSSLSANTYAIVGLEIGETERAYDAFRKSAYRDLRPSTDDAGIHAACLGGTWQAVVNGFAGMRLWGERPSFRPWLPPQWTRMAFTILWRGTRLGIEITRETFTASVLAGPPVDIVVNGDAIPVRRRPTTVVSTRTVGPGPEPGSPGSCPHEAHIHKHTAVTYG